MDEISGKGVNVVYLTLHVSYGTFAPVTCEDITHHVMHREYFELPEQTARVLNETKLKGKRVIAVGTTSCRVLETVANIVNSEEGSKSNYQPSTVNCKLRGQRGWTNLFIYPPYKFKLVDSLLTNFHLPRSTLIMLVSAFCGRQFLLEAYRQAIENGYRFYSYGDCMLII